MCFHLQRRVSNQLIQRSTSLSRNLGHPAGITETEHSSSRTQRRSWDSPYSLPTLYEPNPASPAQTSPSSMHHPTRDTPCSLRSAVWGLCCAVLCCALSKPRPMTAHGGVIPCEECWCLLACLHAYLPGHSRAGSVQGRGVPRIRPVEKGRNL